MHGTISERAIVDGMKSEDRIYRFSVAEVKCDVSINKDGVKTHFRVYKTGFDDYNQALFTTDSFDELRTWLEEHKMEFK